MFPSTFLYLYKTIGLAVNISDKVLAWAGSIAAVTQAIVRCGFGWLYDIYGLKKLLFIILLVNLVLSMICYVSRYNTPVYFVCILFTYSIFAGIFSTYPTAVTNTFGPKYGGQVYAIVVFAGSLCSIFNYLQVKYL